MLVDDQLILMLDNGGALIFTRANVSGTNE